MKKIIKISAILGMTAFSATAQQSFPEYGSSFDNSSYLNKEHIKRNIIRDNDLTGRITRYTDSSKAVNAHNQVTTSGQSQQKSFYQSIIENQRSARLSSENNLYNKRIQQLYSFTRTEEERNNLKTIETARHAAALKNIQESYDQAIANLEQKFSQMNQKSTSEFNQAESINKTVLDSTKVQKAKNDAYPYID